MANTRGERGPNRVDEHVGARIRARRKTLGYSQEHLARSLGLTFQQVQKYERGANRVSASKLYEMAKALQAPVSYFFEGLADPVDPDSDGHATDSAAVREFLTSAEGLALAAALGRIEPAMKKPLVELIHAIAAEAAASGS